MKLGRWWLLIIALMLVVAGWLGTALLGPPLLRQVESQLSRTLNTDVQLGTIQTVLPWQVVVGPVTIDSTLGERDLLRAPRVRVGFSLLGVVFGTGARASLSVEEPEIFLRRDQASLFNLPQLPESTDGPPLETLISRLEVRRGKFIYEDQVLGGTPITLTDLDVEADLAGGKAEYTLRTRLLAGEIQAEGETGLETLETRINARLSALPADRLARVLDLGDLAVRRGTVEGNLQLGLRNGQLTGTGPLRLRSGELVLGSLPPVTTLDVDSSLAWPRLNLNRIQGRLVGARIGGTGRFELPERLLLALDVRDILLERYATALALKLPVAVQGEVNTRLNATLPFNNPRQLTVDGTLSTPGTLKVDRLVVNNLRSRYRYDGERLVAPFSLATASGKVEGTARAQLLGKTRFEVDATGRSLLPEAVASRYGIVIPVVERSGRLNFTARIQVGDRLLGETDFQLSGGSVRNQPFTAAGNLALVGAQLTITDTRVRFPAATRAALIANGQVMLTGTRPLEVRVDIEDLPLSLASSDVGGTANGQIQVRGPLNSGGDLLGALQAEGTLVVDTPRFNTQELPTLNVAFRFEDRVVDLEQFSLGGLEATGRLEPDLNRLNDPTRLLKRVDLRWTARRFDLEELPLDLPVEIGGSLSGQGTLQGNLQQPDLEGLITLRDAQVGDYRFERLRGPVRFQGRTFNATLTGEGDRLQAIAVLETGGVRLTRLAVNVDETRILASDGFYDFATGPARLNAEVQNLDLERLGLEPIGPINSLRGLVDGRLAVRRGKAGLVGNAELAIRDGQINNSAFATSDLKVRLSGDQIVLAPTTIELEGGEYKLAGRAGLGEQSPIDLRVEVTSGRLEQVVSLLGLRSLSTLFSPPRNDLPLGDAGDLGTPRIGGPLGVTPLEELLAAYREVAREAMERLARMSNAFLPDDFSQLSGRFNLSARVSGTRVAPRAKFALGGEDWKWQQWQLETVQAQGNYRDGVLSLDESLAGYQERTGSLTGKLALQGEQDARLTVQGFPLQLLSPLLPPSSRIEGNLSTEAEISGRLDAPVVTAQVRVAELQLNGRAIDPIVTEATLREGRVNLLETRIGIQQQDARLTGSLPVPFLNPDNSQLDLQLSLNGENLPILNLVTDQLVWQPAQGTAMVTVEGTYDEPLIDGRINLSNTAVRVVRLNTDLAITQVEANFDDSRLELDRFEGTLGGARLAASGDVPLLSTDLSVEQPLTLSIEGNTELPRLYRGGVSGQLTLRGALVEPVISGRIEVNPGALLLGLQDFQALAGQGGNATTVSRNTPFGPLDPLPSRFTIEPLPASEIASPTSLPVTFQNLEVRVGPQFRVDVATLSARLDGSLSLNGTLSALEVVGVINVPQGSLQIGSAKFRLDTSLPNTLTFLGSLDPQINLRAEASVSDFRPTGVFTTTSGGADAFRNPSSPLPLDQAPLGRFQRLEVRATVGGPASNPDIELRSSPPRDPGELLAIIGGGLLFGGSGSSSLLTGLLPAIGGGLFSPLERNLAAGLGLDELNIDLASAVASASPQDLSIGVGIEAIKDLTPAISATVFRNLTDGSRPTLFGIRYRLNENFVTRLSTTEGSENQSFSIEYESRF